MHATVNLETPIWLSDISEDSYWHSTFLLEIQLDFWRILVKNVSYTVTDYFIHVYTSTVQLTHVFLLPFTPFGIFLKSFLPRAFWSALKVQLSVPVSWRPSLWKTKQLSFNSHTPHTNTICTCGSINHTTVTMYTTIEFKLHNGYKRFITDLLGKKIHEVPRGGGVRS